MIKIRSYLCNLPAANIVLFRREHHTQYRKQHRTLQRKYYPKNSQWIFLSHTNRAKKQQILTLSFTGKRSIIRYAYLTLPNNNRPSASSFLSSWAAQNHNCCTHTHPDIIPSRTRLNFSLALVHWALSQNPLWYAPAAVRVGMRDGGIFSRFHFDDHFFASLLTFFTFFMLAISGKSRTILNFYSNSALQYNPLVRKFQKKSPKTTTICKFFRSTKRNGPPQDSVRPHQTHEIEKHARSRLWLDYEWERLRSARSGTKYLRLWCVLVWFASHSMWKVRWEGDQRVSDDQDIKFCERCGSVAEILLCEFKKQKNWIRAFFILYVYFNILCKFYT